MSMIQPLLAELEMEAATLKRHLSAIPDAKLGWKPHAKSMSLGQLANHMATLPGNVAGLMQQSAVPAPEFALPPQPKTKAEILAALDASLAQAKSLLGGMTDADLMAEFRVMAGDKPVMAMPRIAVARAILLNHLYHHRGQFTVYLRLLDIKVPATYGNTADENPFKM